MLEVLQTLIKLRDEIKCDEVRISWDGKFVVIKAYIDEREDGMRELQRTYAEVEVRQICDSKLITDSCITYMSNAFHNPPSVPMTPKEVSHEGTQADRPIVVVTPLG